MKKILLASLITTMVLSFTVPTVPAFAAKTEIETVNSENMDNPSNINTSPLQEITEYEYNYEDLIITSNIELNDVDFQRIKQEVTEPVNRAEITPYGPVQQGTYTGTIIHGPINRVNNNKSVQVVADVFFAFVGSKIPGRYTNSTFKNYIVSSMLGWNAKPTYTSEWISRATYTHNTSYWQYFTTIVRQSSSRFNNPTHVTYYSTHIQKK